MDQTTLVVHVPHAQSALDVSVLRALFQHRADAHKDRLNRGGSDRTTSVVASSPHEAHLSPAASLKPRLRGCSQHQREDRKQTRGIPRELRMNDAHLLDGSTRKDDHHRRVSSTNNSSVIRHERSPELFQIPPMIRDNTPSSD